MPKFLNHVSQAVSVALLRGAAYWDAKTPKYQPLPGPIHEKFLGDGMLYVWRLKRNQSDFDPVFIRQLCNRLWNVKESFANILKQAAVDVPVLDLPTRIRFGVARGTVYELTRASGANKEYIGFCINLASRLQKYCADLGFIVSARLGLPEQFIEKWDYKRVVATKIRGFPEEIVVVDRQGMKHLLKPSAQACLETYDTRVQRKSEYSDQALPQQIQRCL